MEHGEIFTGDPQKLLGRINRRFGVLNGVACTRQGTANEADIKSLIFGQSFDLAIVGGQAEPLDRLAAEHPMGATSRGTDSMAGPAISWLDLIVRDRSPKTVLVIPGSRGQHPPTRQALIREGFHWITWTFPELIDGEGLFLRDTTYTLGILDALLRQRILISG